MTLFRFIMRHYYRQTLKRFLTEKRPRQLLVPEDMSALLVNYFYYEGCLYPGMPLTEDALSNLESGIVAFLKEAESKQRDFSYDEVQAALKKVPFYNDFMKETLQNVIENYDYWYSPSKITNKMRKYHRINPQTKARTTRLVNLTVCVAFTILTIFFPHDTEFTDSAQIIFRNISIYTYAEYLIGLIHLFAHKMPANSTKMPRFRKYAILFIFSAIVFRFQFIPLFIDGAKGLIKGCLIVMGLTLLTTLYLGWQMIRCSSSSA